MGIGTRMGISLSSMKRLKYHRILVAMGIRPCNQERIDLTKKRFIIYRFSQRHSENDGISTAEDWFQLLLVNVYHYSTNGITGDITRY